MTITNNTAKLSLGIAALIAGLAILTMAIAAPFAELYVYPKLVVSDKAAETAKNIVENETLFICGKIWNIATIRLFQERWPAVQPRAFSTPLHARDGRQLLTMNGAIRRARWNC